MNRRLVLGLSMSLSVLLLLSFVFLYFYFREPGVLDLLFDGTGEFGTIEGLDGVTRRMRSILSRGGSMDNLFHFLSKEPGRKYFVRHTDRKRAESYLSGARPVNEEGWPGRVTEFAGEVDFLFNNVMDDLLPLLGLPDGFSDQIENRKGSSILQSNMNAIKLFSDNWRRQDTSSGLVRQSDIREFLLANSKFRRLMREQDRIWTDLSKKLQELSTIDSWATAVNLVPRLEKELNELRIVLLAADIHRHTVDLLSSIPPRTVLNILDIEPGLNWWPEMSFYKNLPELTGNTADGHIFFIRINIGFENADNRTSSWIIAHKDWIVDFLKSFFSEINSKDLSALEADETYTMAWKMARIKAEIINYINSRIAFDKNPRFRRAMGIRQLAFLRINILDYN